ncbi:MAG: glycosyltransferase family 4 protein, partial [Actinomycetota bacterium]
GLDIALEAWKTVAARFPDVVFKIAGEGPMRRALEDLNIPRVEFLGKLSADGVRELLDSVWALVVPSRTEGLGRVILEAQARARPVVAFAVGAVPELVEEGQTGLLVPAGDSFALGDAMARLLSDRKHAERLGRRGREALMARDKSEEFEKGIKRTVEWIKRSAGAAC